ncbi:L-fuconolactonase [Filimonas lacunae]|uniref:L-fuconolactonase n=1 Tax=Filimonas lacunae TaxID=477680 RepID=A0A173MAI7_9BACT|nr:amidohydrolase family protein [Filimonas lacunae]BAV04511.1 L-fuconolactone hydrolase [Filimonas lacunae]SIT31636.1 L-fuconolactonase [Filimonas lacunae]
MSVATPIPRIDAHQHFWQFDPVRDSWITDDMSVIQRDFFAEHLAPVLEANGFDGSVLVQADQSEAQNHFMLQQANGHPFIKGIVGWVDLQAAAIADRLAYFSHYPLIKGFRHVLQGETDRQLMLKPAFMHGISQLQQYGFTYDVLIFPDQLPYIPELAKAFPQQKLVIDHIAKPYIKKGDIAQWKKDMKLLAQCPNVWCKVSGMVTEADWANWKEEDFRPYLDVVTEAFGMERLMYGSDWPVCQVAGSYEKMLSIVQHYYASFSQQEQALFFGLNATRFYQLA